MPFLWAKSAALVAWVGLDPKNEIYVAITYELLESLQVLIPHISTIEHCFGLRNAWWHLARRALKRI